MMNERDWAYPPDVQRIWFNGGLVYEVPSDDELLRARVRELRTNARKV